MNSRSPSRERYGRSPTPRSRYSRSPSQSRRRRSSSRPYSPPPRRAPVTSRYRSESLDRSWSRSRSRSPSLDRESRDRSESPLRGSTKIVIEKLTKTINEEHLREIFARYGPIKDLHLPMSRQFNTNRGVAYVLYVHEADAEAAIAHMHEGMLDGATINVSIVFPRRKFSPEPPTAARGANIDPRVPAPRGPRDGGRRGRGGHGGFGGGFAGSMGGGGGGRGRPRSPAFENNYRPARSASRSRSLPRRRRSPSYDSRSRSPAPRRGGGGGAGRGRGRRDSFVDDYNRSDRKRSPSYDSYRSRSISRGRNHR